MVEVRRLTASEVRAHLSALADVLFDCVEGGASVSFMKPFPKSQAEAFYRRIADSVEAGERMLLAAFNGTNLVGTVQVITAMPPNQPHRADVAKLLVLRSARGSGVGTALMEEAERHSAAEGKTLLVLDTATGGDAERLYERLNWVKVGVIPRYAQLPDGAWCATTIFWKGLDGR